MNGHIRGREAALSRPDTRGISTSRPRLISPKSADFLLLDPYLIVARENVGCSSSTKTGVGHVLRERPENRRDRLVKLILWRDCRR